MARFKHANQTQGLRLLLRVATLVLVILALYSRSSARQRGKSIGSIWPSRSLVAMVGGVSLAQPGVTAQSQQAEPKPQPTGTPGVTKIGTYTVVEDGKEVTKDLLDEPIPQECHAEPHADYSGASAAWVVKKQSALECCRACKEFPANADGKKCNVWVFCPDPSGICFTADGWKHQSGECWLKFQADWDNNLDLSHTNLLVNRRGEFSKEYKEKNPGAPKLVPWMSGAIPSTSHEATTTNA